MRNASLVAFAIALAGLSGSANAFTSVAADVTTDTTWAAANGPFILEQPIFVRDGATLTIEKGTVIRGQPRTAAVQAGIIAGTPGALIVTQTGRIEAIGTEAEPIIFTTAAIDDSPNDGAPDVCGSFLCPFTGTEAFLDDSPLSQPLAPFDLAGNPTVSLWGGMVIEGNAPTNLFDKFAVGVGKGLVEGLTVPGFPATQATYGGVDPHDSSGTLKFVRIIHAGDEIGEGNELNCLSLAGVGDGTVLSHVECSTNFDDGFEWFGGTVDGDHLASFYIGDDTFDLDLGYTGVNQFLFGIMPTWSVNGAADWGSKSGDKGGEWDGDDFAERGGDINVRAEGQPAGTDPARAWPFSNPNFYNLTLIGSTPDAGVVNPAIANPACDPASANTGIQMRNGFGGKLLNSIVVNTAGKKGLEVTVGDGSLPSRSAVDNANNGEVAVVSSTFDDVDAMGAAETTALTNGDGIRCALGAACVAPFPYTSENHVNGVFTTSGVGAGAFLGLAQETTAIDCDGNASGKLDVTSLAGGVATDPRPLGLFGAASGVPPQGSGLDSSATYRGAFAPGAPTWLGFTSLGKAGLVE